MKVSIAFSGNGKKSLENALTVSIGFHCLFVNFLALISFMHNERELRTYATAQKWELSGLGSIGGRGGERKCEYATAVKLLCDMTHCTMKMMFSSVVITAWSRPV